MALPLVVDGVTFNYPEPGDRGLAQDATNWANAITTALATAETNITALGNKPYVRAHITAAQTGISAFTTIVFNTEDSDSTGSYNNVTGVFTAPSAGQYLIAAGFVVQQKTGTGLVEASLYWNNVQNAEFGATNLGANEFGFCGSAIVLNLAINDTVQIKLKTSANTVDTTASNTSTLSIKKLV